MKRTCHIEVVSDIVCPWCYVGLGQLTEALTQIEAASVEVTVGWSPFMLNPHMPVEGISRHDYLVQKFGENGLARYGRVQAYARQVGIEMRLESIKVQPNSLDGHILVAAAGPHEGSVVEHLFEAFFRLGRDLTQREELIDIAEKAGMDRRTAEASLNDPVLRQQVMHAADDWQKNGIDGVPAFRITADDAQTNWLYGAVGAEVLREAILKA